MSSPNLELIDLQNIINKALKVLIQRDVYLLENEAHERAICHRLAIYIEDQLKKYKVNVDCEYNRDGEIPKALDSLMQNVLPDIILHFRGSDSNFLIVEVKKNSKLDEEDRKKIAAYIKEYNYQYGLVLSVYDPKKGEHLQEWWKLTPNRMAERQVSGEQMRVSLQAVEKLNKVLPKLGIKNSIPKNRRDRTRYVRKLAK